MKIVFGLRLLNRLALLLLCSACSAQMATTKPAIQLERLSYKEAVSAYRSANRDENYRCIHQVADEQFNAEPEAPAIAIAIDDVLYLKLNGRLLELTQTDISENSARYRSSDGKLEAGYSIIKQFNFSEYNESDDRYVDLWVKTPDGTQHVSTFGNRCGV